MHIAPINTAHRDIDRQLALSLELVVHAEQTSLACALDDLGDITLPPGGATAADGAHLRTVASLYLAAELEQAMLVPAAEMLAGLATGAGLPGEPAPETMQKLATFWQGRHQRASPEERRALYGRLFGGGDSAQAMPTGSASQGGPNEQFEPLLIDLCEALYKLDEQGTVAGSRYGGPGPEARVGITARRLSDNLVQHGGGMALFLARDILATVHQALDLLRRHDLCMMYRARDWRDLIEAVAQRYLHTRAVDVQTHLERAAAGTTIMSWLAGIAPSLGGAASPMVTIDDPVIAAAATWLQTSLHLGEQAQAEQTEFAPVGDPSAIVSSRAGQAAYGRAG
jgi:hypothetical protein